MPIIFIFHAHQNSASTLFYFMRSAFFIVPPPFGRGCGVGLSFSLSLIGSSPKLGEVSLATEGCVTFRFRYRFRYRFGFSFWFSLSLICISWFFFRPGLIPIGMKWICIFFPKYFTENLAITHKRRNFAADFKLETVADTTAHIYIYNICVACLKLFL